MQMSFDPDGAHGMLTLGPWGGGSGGVAYVGSVRPEGVKKLTKEVSTAIRAGAEACWDAYMSSITQQQNYEAQKAQMNLDGATAIYDYLEEHDGLADTMGASGKLISAGYNIYSGTMLILAPVPTPADDLLGVRKLTFGIYNLCYGIAQMVGALTR